MIWLFLFAGMFILTVLGIIYLISRIGQFSFIKKWARGSKKKSRLIGFLVIGITELVLVTTIHLWNAMVCSIHLLLFWLLCDGIYYLYKKITKKTLEKYIAGGCAVLISVLYLGMGWFFAHHVFQTQYQIGTDKNIGVESFRVVCFSDSHVGTTFHYQKFADYIDEMNACNPDVVVIAGDFVDDDTTKEDMIRSCEELGRLQTAYGVYFVYGNHDKGYYGNEIRGYSAADLRDNLTKNGVIILEDELQDVVENIAILGRQDSQVQNRAPMRELSKEFSADKFVITLDHEPNDYANEAASGVDVVLSGHTHGGQLIPILKAGEWLGQNDRTYGYERRDNTQFIVSSGISDWAIKFKTGCIAEYLLIDIAQN